MSFDLGKQYRKCWDLIKESRRFIYFIVGIFVLSALVGFFVPAPDALSEQLLELIRQLMEKTVGMSAGQLVSFIFFNNLLSSIYAIALGIVLGIFPVLASVANGYLLGFVGRMAVGEGGLLVLWRILPHGIFELPAVFISFGLGMKLGSFVWKKKKFETLKKYISEVLRVLILVVVPLLVVAAAIEGVLIAFAG